MSSDIEHVLRPTHISAMECSAQVSAPTALIYDKKNASLERARLACDTVSYVRLIHRLRSKKSGEKVYRLDVTFSRTQCVRGKVLRRTFKWCTRTLWKAGSVHHLNVAHNISFMRCKKKTETKTKQKARWICRVDERRGNVAIIKE